MVADEISAGTHQPLHAVIEYINSFPKGTKFDLFGGEPTLYPHFKELLRYLSENGIHYQIASHCRTFADEEFTRFVKSMHPDMVHTSLYGSNARTHDSLTRSKGSWQQSIEGMRNVVAEGIPCLVNYLIFRNNLDELSYATQMLYDIGIRRFKFSLPIRTARFLPLLANIANVRERLSECIDFVQSQHGTEFMLEKAPFCVAPRHLRHFYMENDEGMVARLSLLYTKADVCEQCDLHLYCHGVEIGYLERQGTADIKPIALEELSSNSILRMTSDELLQYEPNLPLTLVSVSDPQKYGDASFVASLIAKTASLRKRGRFLGIL